MTTLTTLPADAFITKALDELLADVAGFIVSTKQTRPIDRDELKFWERQQNALNRAAYHWARGVRPEVSGDDYLMPSVSRPGGIIHRLTQQGGIWVCSCEAGQHGLLCWHHQLICVIIRAAELAAETSPISGSGPDSTPEAAATLLAERLEATAQIIDAMRAAQHRQPVLHIGQRLAAARQRLYAEAA